MQSPRILHRWSDTELLAAESEANYVERPLRGRAFTFISAFILAGVSASYACAGMRAHPHSFGKTRIQPIGASQVADASMSNSDDSADQTQEQLETQAHAYVMNDASQTDGTEGRICHTTVKGEECFNNTVWAMTEGLIQHPEWYQGLSHKSSLEDFQAHLSTTTPKKHCPQPCEGSTTLEDAGYMFPSLFCFARAMKGLELEVIQFQYQKRSGIYACDATAVFSEEELTIAPGVKSVYFKPAPVGISSAGEAANTLLFMHVWEAVSTDGQWAKHDWTLKVDPDAVIFPDRLRGKLRPHTGKSAYIRNCNVWPGQAMYPMMYGSLEVFSRQAMQTYFSPNGMQRCGTQLAWQPWGEDLYMGNCMNLLGVTHVDDFTIISDELCTVEYSEQHKYHPEEPAKVKPCYGDAGGYHPFKLVNDWKTCFNQAIGKLPQ